ncbi:MAG: replicative DNA helicase [Abyssibacter sp.]|uniref:replicative DNA helicase n=1 Tax=Abyssibacter sp. TaxID=2320200 RepID=UPI003219E574
MADDFEGPQIRMAPYDQGAEQAVLGGLMMQADAWDRIADLVAEADFYRRDHRLIFAALAYLAGKNEPRDIVTVSARLKAVDALEDAGGLTYLGTLANDMGSAANIRAYADIVRGHGIRRRLVAVGTDITDLGFDSQGLDVAQLVDKAEVAVAELSGAAKRHHETGPRRIGSVLDGWVDYLDQQSREDRHVTGVSTTLSALDAQTTGLQPGELVVVGARPSMGKTSLAMQIAGGLALRQVGSDDHGTSLVFSLEMPIEQLTSRVVSGFWDVPGQSLRKPWTLDDVDWDRIAQATQALERAPLIVDDCGRVTVMEIRRKARAVKRSCPAESPLRLITIDYLQLIETPRRRGEVNRTTEVAEITRELKHLARELQVPIVLLSQLNRSLENRPDKRPRMSDLRESGGIEQDADLILFLYRDEVYNPSNTAEQGIAEIIVAKQRNGPLGTVDAEWHAPYTRFSDYGGPGRKTRKKLAESARKNEQPAATGLDY